MNLALFDFDGTITTKDSFIDFVKYIKGSAWAYLGFALFLPHLALLKIGLVSRENVKQKIFSYFFRGNSLAKLSDKIDSYVEKQLPLIIKKSALDRIEFHKERGDEVYLVSASLDLWLKKWTESQDVNLICTQVEFDSSTRITGFFATPNCYGSEKVSRIKACIDLNKFDQIYAYGNSKGDKEMIELAVEKFYRFFS